MTTQCDSDAVITAPNCKSLFIPYMRGYKLGYSQPLSAWRTISR